MRTLSKKDQFLEIDSLLFKGIDFPPEPFIASISMQSFFTSGKGGTAKGSTTSGAKGVIRQAKPLAKSPTLQKQQTITPQANAGKKTSQTRVGEQQYPFFRFAPSEQLLRELIKKAISMESPEQMDIEKARAIAQAEGAAKTTKKKA